MDREATPAKQRQKRGAKGKSSGGFRPSGSGGGGSTQRPRGRAALAGTTVAAPAAILSKPPAASPAAPSAPTGTLWEPPDARRASQSGLRASTGGLQRSHSGLTVSTRLSAPGGAPGGASGLAPASPLDRRSPVMARKASAPPLAPPQLPLTRVKLVTPALQVATDLASRLGGCLEASNLAVVGVLGLDGVGKSTVASLLARTDRDAGAPAAATAAAMFPSQSLETLALGRCETTGVDLAVVPNGPGLASSVHHRHLVLLDAQPALSGILLADLLARSDSTASASVQQQQQQQRGFFNPPAALSAEQQIDVASHQLAVFLASVCHYIVVVHDALAGDDSDDALALARFMRGVRLRLEQSRLPHISGTQAGGRKHVAKLLFVANNVVSADEAAGCEALRRHVAAVEAMWGGGLLVRARRGPLTPVVMASVAQTAPTRDDEAETPTKGKRRNKPSSGGSPSGAIARSSAKRGDGDADAEGVPIFVLPHNRSLWESPTDKALHHVDATPTRLKRQPHDARAFDDAARALRRFVRALPADATFSAASAPPGAAALSSAGVSPTETSARPLTLREWLSNASRVFDAVRKSNVFTAEYAVGR